MIYRSIAVSILICLYAIYLFVVYLPNHKILKNYKKEEKSNTLKQKIVKRIMWWSSILVPFAEIACIIEGRCDIGIMGRVIGIYLGVIGNAIYFFGVKALGRLWYGQPDDDKKLVTGKIFIYTRNPAYLGIDLVYIGLLLMYFSPILLIFTIIPVVMFHLQIIEEEKELQNLFGDEFSKYRKYSHRYMGYGKWSFNTLRCLFYLVLTFFSLFYYLTCAFYAGPRLSFIWIWLLLAAFSYIRYRMTKVKINQSIIADRRGVSITEIYTRAKWRKIVSGVYYVIFAIAFSIFLIVEGNIIIGMNTEAPNNLDYVVVLGAGLKGEEPTRPLYQRILKAYEYMSENPDTMLIASGGKGKDEVISEAMCIYTNLVAMGIEPERIILEDKSTSTEENIKYSFEKINDNKSVGVITNSFHIYRAEVIAKKQGHKVYGVPAKTLYPVGVHYTVREFFGIIWLYLFSK